MCPCPTCSAPSGLAFLDGQVLDGGHERVRGDRRGFEIRVPVARTGRQDHVLALLADEHLVRRKLVLLRQADRLAAVGHENLRGAGHVESSDGIMPYTFRIWRRVLYTCLYPAFRADLSD